VRTRSRPFRPSLPRVSTANKKDKPPTHKRVRQMSVPKAVHTLAWMRKTHAQRNAHPHDLSSLCVASYYPGSRFQTMAEFRSAGGTEYELKLAYVPKARQTPAGEGGCQGKALGPCPGPHACRAQCVLHRNQAPKAAAAAEAGAIPVKANGNLKGKCRICTQPVNPSRHYHSVSVHNRERIGEHQRWESCAGFRLS